jgi:predicted amidohydrolase
MKLMVKLGLIQTAQYRDNKKGILQISKILKKLGRENTDIVCLPEQWLKNNEIGDFDLEFLDFKKIAKEFSMTIIPGAFYEYKKQKTSPFDYEKDKVKPGKEAKIFNTACRFGVVICYDMVFPMVANTFVKKGAQVLFSPSRIVRRGIEPWQMYVQVRALENRIPILAANVENQKYGGNSLIIDLTENNKVVTTKVMKLNGECGKSKEFDLHKYEKSRKIRLTDSNNFQ